MTMTIEIERGSQDSQSRTLETGLYSLGRSPECDLSFDGSGSESVSWNHAEIAIRGEGVFLKDLNSSNGTWLNGRKIPVETKILDGDEIRLGQSGPRVRVVKMATAAMVPSAKSAAPDGNGNGNGNGPPAFGGKNKDAASPFGGARPAVPGRPPQQPAASPKPAAAPSQSPAATVSSANDRGPSSTRAMLIEMRKSQRGWRGVGIAAAVALCIALVVAVILLTTSSLRNQREADRKREELADRTKVLSGETEKLRNRPSTELDTKAIMAANQDCVYLVGQINGTKVKPFGTAFAISPDGRFGTNGHVTQPLEGFLKRGETYYVIGEGGRVKYKILSAKTHPDYRPKSETPDVGVLTVELPPGTKLKTVQLGTDEDIKDLSDGSKLCYIGFPVYWSQDYADASQVKSRINPGNVVRMLTLKRKVGEPKDQDIIEHNMMSWGGASGSPIFNVRGRVVGLHFSAQRVLSETLTIDPATKTSKKVLTVQDSPSGTKYGVRINRLRELLK